METLRMSQNRYELDACPEVLPQAVVAHQIRGRCRLVVPSMRGNPRYFTLACARLRTIPSLRNVRVSRITGSIVLEYTGSFEQIAWIGRRHRLFLIEALPARQAARPRQVPRHWVRRGPYSGSPIENLRNAATATRLQRPWLALTLGGLGAYQLWRADPLATVLNVLFVLLNETPRTNIPLGACS